MTNHEGEKCKRCGQTIATYSLSGICRKCWHAKRGYRVGSMEERINAAIERHKNDLHSYHFLSINGVQVPEHRYIIERETGKKLPRGWVVHHLNGLKGDNRIENLVGMPRGDHNTKHLITALQERIYELEQLHFPI